MMTDPIISTDSYKLCHWKQYPPGTEKIYSYYESRGGSTKEVVFYGLYYLLARYLPEYISSEDVNLGEEFCDAHFRQKGYFNREGWQYISDKYGEILPIRIRAVPEGAVVPVGNVMMTIENTDPKCYWLTNFLETMLCQVWYPISVATLSREIKKTLKKGLKKTSDLSEEDQEKVLQYMLHDFGMRGATCMEAAMVGGSAHLVNFSGTDTMPAITHINAFHGRDGESYKMYGHSVAASEHSTMTSWGREHESDAYANMLNQYDGPVSIVSDSYDIFNAVKNLWGLILQEDVKNHKGTVIIRPDSGDPVAVTLGVLSELELTFGSTTNSKGFKVLPPNIRVLWGDGLSHNMIKRMIKCLKLMKWSLENMAFGMGGGLLQKVNRDTHKLAFKCSYAEVNGEGRDVYKTASGKASKRGRMKLVDKQGKLTTVPELEDGQDLLVDYYTPEEGLLQASTFEDIRKRAAL